MGRLPQGMGEGEGEQRPGLRAHQPVGLRDQRGAQAALTVVAAVAAAAQAADVGGAAQQAAAEPERGVGAGQRPDHGVLAPGDVGGGLEGVEPKRGESLTDGVGGIGQGGRGHRRPRC